MIKPITELAMSKKGNIDFDVKPEMKFSLSLTIDLTQQSNQMATHSIIIDRTV
jgi:hypothetical protein